MNKIFTTFSILVVLISRLAAQPLMVSTNFATIDFDENGSWDVLYAADSTTDGSSWNVGVGAIAGAGLEILRLSNAELFFAESDQVSEQSPKNINPWGYNDARLTSYVGFQNEFLEWIYLERFPEDSPGQRLVVILGLRFRIASSWHYGWLRFARPDGRLETLFTLQSYDWNPIPDAPIRAGLPPEVPIQSEWLPDGSAIRLSWPAAAATWTLESASSLTLPMSWEAYPSAGTYADVVPNEAGRLFRLRKP